MFEPTLPDAPRRTLFLGALLAVVVLPFGMSAARAEDEPAKKHKQDAPSPLHGLSQDDLAKEAQPEDPVAYLRSFRDWIAEHERAPAKGGTNQPVFEVWKAVLRPRATRMKRRLERLMKRKYWLPEDGTPERVKQAAWSTFVRELGGLITELGGAFSRYDQVVLRDRGGKLETTGNRRHRTVYRGYGLPVQRWQAGIRFRQGISLRWRRFELNSYWNLMARFRTGWNWRITECRNCEARKKELKDRSKQVEQSQQLIDTTRETLRQQMLSLQVLAAAMQAQEEVVVAEQIDGLDPDHLLREPAENLLAALRKARLKAERYDGDSSSQYAQLLRNWVRAFKAGTALLAKEERKLEDAEDDEDDDEADDAKDAPKKDAGK